MVKEKQWEEKEAGEYNICEEYNCNAGVDFLDEYFSFSTLLSLAPSFSLAPLSLPLLFLAPLCLPHSLCLYIFLSILSAVPHPN